MAALNIQAGPHSLAAALTRAQDKCGEKRSHNSNPARSPTGANRAKAVTSIWEGQRHWRRRKPSPKKEEERRHEPEQRRHPAPGHPVPEARIPPPSATGWSAVPRQTTSIRGQPGQVQSAGNRLAVKKITCRRSCRYAHRPGGDRPHHHGEEHPDAVPALPGTNTSAARVALSSGKTDPAE